MAILGAHMSIAGGYYKAVEAAERATCDCVQIFTKNNSQWKAKPITDEEANRFRDTLASSTVGHPIAHSSYLLNLASPDRALWKKSVDAFVIELRRAGQLGIPNVVLHPGAYTDSSESEGISAVIAALDEVHGQTESATPKCLLETTAGQGTTLGWRFEQLAQMLSGASSPERLGVCLDTCHVFAAGYGLTSPRDYEQTMKEFDRTVGIAQIKAIHLNDSKREQGSRVDRHEHIGRGQIGEPAFAHFLSDDRFTHIPMYLETPKGKDDQGHDLDAVNLKTLRRLASKVP